MKTKIQLLPFEMDLVGNTDIILTKNAIIQKIKLFLEELQVNQLSIIEKYQMVFPKEVLITSPKISKGENYKGLPWLILDNPRHFNIDNTFAIRTMFWWGNFFSITLHLSGQYKFFLQTNIIKNYTGLSSGDAYLCVEENQWEHDLDSRNYKLIHQLTADEMEKIINEKSFLKIAKKFPIDQLDKMETILSENFELLLNFCN